jgi:hypothetical protein
MEFQRLIAELEGFAECFADVADDGSEPDAPPRDLSTLFDRHFLGDVSDTLRMILELPEDLSTRRAPIAAALIVLEFARRQAEVTAAAIEEEPFDAEDAALRDGHPGPDEDCSGGDQGP